MSLYSEWMERAQQERTSAEQQAFWDAYFAAEKENYKVILQHSQEVFSGKHAELAAQFGMDEITFTGFLDGINTSLKAAIELDTIESESEISLGLDFEKLYYNMLDAKAEWLYTLPEWDGVLSEDVRKGITKEFRASKIFVNETTVGRNDPCPCGSGKKYKKCCGAN